MSRTLDDPDPSDGTDRLDPMGPGSSPGGRLRPAGVGVVLLLVVFGLVLGGLVLALFDLVDVSVPVTPWTLPPLLALLGLLGAVLASRLRRARPDPTTWERWVAGLVAGRSMLAVGLLTAGAHITLALGQVPQLPASLPRDRLVWGLVTAFASAILAGGGWLLEKACRSDRQTPGDGDGEGV